MVLEVFGAVLAATLFAAVLLPFRDYHYWFSWSRPALLIGALLYFVFAGLFAGGLGWLIGHASKALPTEYVLVNGLVFGVAGALAVRADLGAKKPLDRPRGAKQGDLAPAVSLLSLGTSWTLAMMDKLVDQQIERWFDNLGDEELLKNALVLVQRIETIEGLSTRGKNDAGKRFAGAMTNLRRGTEEEKIEARIRIQQFGSTLMQQQRWSKPMSAVGQSTSRDPSAPLLRSFRNSAGTPDHGER